MLARISTLLALLLLASTPAFAQDAESVAHQRFLRGMQRYDAGQFDEALAEFRASYATYASPNSRLFIARSLRELGRVAEAVVEFDTTLAEAAERTHGDARYQQTEEAAAEERRVLESRIGRLLIDVPNPPDGVVLRINGDITPQGALGIALPVSPGRVVVSVEAPGYRPATGQVTVLVGQRARLPLEMVRDASVVVARTPTARARPWFDPQWLLHGHGALPALTWTGYVTAVIALVGVAAFALGADATYHELQARCGDQRCAPSDRDVIDRGRTLEALTNASIGVAAVAAVGATAMWAGGSRSDTRPSVRAVVGLGIVGLAGVF